MPQITYCKVVCYLCLRSSVQMCLATYYTKMARGRRLKVGAPFIMQPFFHSFKAGKKHIFGVTIGAQCSSCADQLTGCSGLIRAWPLMNRTHLFILLFANCKIKVPVYPKLIDFLHIVKKLGKTFSFYESARC